jgi:hypothetical protein
VKDSANGEARRFLAEGYERAGRTLAAGAEWTRAARANPEDEVLASELLEYAVRHPETRFRARLLVTGMRRAIPRPGERLAKAFAAFTAVAEMGGGGVERSSANPARRPRPRRLG